MGEVISMIARRLNGAQKVGSAIVCLASAGTLLVTAREWADSPEAGALIDALRDDIARLIGDTEALQKIIRQG